MVSLKLAYETAFLLSVKYTKREYKNCIGLRKSGFLGRFAFCCSTPEEYGLTGLSDL
jgi:hypothetical protein